MKYLKSKIGGYQYLLVKERSTVVDSIHLMKQIMEEAYKYNLTLEMLFIDFKSAFETIKTNKLRKTLVHVKIKPIRQ